jgi:hypothetical protein
MLAQGTLVHSREGREARRKTLRLNGLGSIWRDSNSSLPFEFFFSITRTWRQLAASGKIFGIDRG